LFAIARRDLRKEKPHLRNIEEEVVMTERLERFRAEAERIGEGRGRKFPRELIALGAEYAREQREAGASWERIAKDMRVAVPTVQRWARLSPVSAASFHAVAVVEQPMRAGYSAVLPGGLRIEGLELNAVVALAKALS
jgi:hypothetical protein